MGATSGTSDRPARSRSARPSTRMCPGAAPRSSESSSPEHCSGANRSYRCPRNMIEVARQATPGSPSTRLVYLVAAIHGQGNPDWHCYASVETIALKTQLSRRTVQYRVAALVAAGLLEPVRHPKGQQRRSRRYVVRAGVSPDSLPESPRKPFPRVVGSSSATVPEAEMTDPFPGVPVLVPLPLSGSCFDAAPAPDQRDAVVPDSVDTLTVPTSVPSDLVPESRSTAAVPAEQLHALEDSLNLLPASTSGLRDRLSTLPERAGRPLTCSLNVQPVARSAVVGGVESRASVEGSATDGSSLSSTATESSLSDAPDPLRLPRLLDAHAGGASPFTTAAHSVLERAGWRFDGACWHGPDCRHPG